MKQSTSTVRRMWDHVAHPRRLRHGLRLILALLVLVVSALPLDRGSISSAEASVFSAVNTWPDWSGWFLVPIMQFGTFVAIVAFSLLALWPVRRPRIAVDLAVSGSVAWILARVIKTTVERGRPDELLTEVILRGPAAAGYGYISGHTAVAAALATVIAAYVGTRGKIAMVAVAALVGAARMFVGAHLPLDVIGGAAMGWAVGSLVHFLVLPEIMRDEDAPDTTHDAPTGRG